MAKYDVLFNIVTLVLTCQLCVGIPTQNIQKINKRQIFKNLDENRNIQKIEKRQVLQSDKRVPIEKRDVIFENSQIPREVQTPNENNVMHNAQQFRYNPQTRTFDLIDKISDGIAHGISAGISNGVTQSVYALPDAIAGTVHNLQQQYGYPSSVPVTSVLSNKLHNSFSSAIPSKGYSIGNLGLGGHLSEIVSPNFGYPGGYVVPNTGLSSPHSLGYSEIDISSNPLRPYSSFVSSKPFSSGIVQTANVYQQASHLLNKKPTVVLSTQSQETLPFHWDCRLTPVLNFKGGNKLFRDSDDHEDKISELSDLIEQHMNGNSFARFNTNNGNVKFNNQVEQIIPMESQVQNRNSLNKDDELRKNIELLEEMNVNWPPVSMIDHNKLVEFKSNNNEDNAFQQYENLVPNSELFALYLPLSKAQQGIYSKIYDNQQQNNPSKDEQNVKLTQNSNLQTQKTQDLNEENIQNSNVSTQNLNDNTSNISDQRNFKESEWIEKNEENEGVLGDAYKNSERDNMINDEREC